ncbi:MAG: Uma2 family endonuclease [bacterium]|nr:Uma2 family endonuclease [bacterium]
MSLQLKPRLTLISPEEYLAIERNAEHKSEYFDGEIFAMAGAGKRHNLIVTNIVRELSLQMKGRPCEVYSNDMRVKVSSTGLYTYPDVVVMCGTSQLEDDQQDTLLNPTVIIEVLSKSTESYDRGGKFAHYRRLETLAEYILVAQDKCFVEHYIRQPDNQWLLSEIGSLQDTVQLPSIKCSLALTEVYDKVEIGNSLQI